jgi:hypothetical protein
LTGHKDVQLLMGALIVASDLCIDAHGCILIFDCAAVVDLSCKILLDTPGALGLLALVLSNGR